MCLHVCACDRAHVCACACACVRRGQERRLLEGTVSQLGPGGPGREPHQPAGPWSLSCPPRCPATRVFSANRSLFPLCPAAPFIPLGARPGPARPSSAPRRLGVEMAHGASCLLSGATALTATAAAQWWEAGNSSISGFSGVLFGGVCGVGREESGVKI